MRIGIDARPLQLESYKERGIGSYLRGWIEAAQFLTSPHNFCLVYDPRLPAPAIKLTSEQWKLDPLDLPFSPPPSGAGVLHIQRDEEFQFDSAMEAFLLDRQYDLFHTTFSLMWETYVSRRTRYTASVVTFFDLIPLLFREEYLDPYGETAYSSFAQRVGASVYAQRVQTISRASRDDLVRAVGLEPSKIDVVYGGVDASFVPLSPTQVAPTLADLGVVDPYIFCVSGFHHTKNLRRMFEAYSLLPAPFRKDYRLVVLCPLSPHAHALIQKWLTDLEIQERVTLLQGIRQPQLVALYNGAKLVVHPSLYEGLGLPIVEAMGCGTPVVTSNVSSMPEIAAGAARLVDPDDAREVARGIGEVLASPILQGEMRELGFQRAAEFTWEKTAEGVLDSYGKVIEQFDHPHPVAGIGHYPERRLRLSFWSPLNPKPSGVSDYSELLLAELREEAEVDVFLGGYQPSNLPLYDSMPMFDARAYNQIAERHPYDMNLYQAGNNPLHSYMYQSILEHPGIITLHDTCLYHLIHAVLALGPNPKMFWDEVAYSEGSAAARRAQIDYVKGQLDDYSLPLNRRLVEASRCVVTHSEWAAKQIRQGSATTHIEVIPFGMFALEEDGGRFGKLVRRLIGLPETAFIFGVFGNIHRVKRLPVVLSAFARVHEKFPATALFIMGPVDSSAAETIYPFQTNSDHARAQGVYLDLNYADYGLMLMAMQGVDVGINLRYPTAGETSGTLSMLLGQGKPAILSAIGSYLEYPDLCSPKVPIDENEENVLYEYMMGLSADKSRYQQAVQEAFAFSRDKMWRACARQYVNLVERLVSHSVAQ